MQTVKSFFARHRRLFLTLIVALCAALAAAWAGFDLSQRVDNQPVYEIVNDDYTRTVTIPRAESPSDPDTGLYQPLPLHAVCSAEPGIYLPGKFGVRIEDVTILTQNSAIDITASPKNLIIV